MPDQTVQVSTPLRKSRPFRLMGDAIRVCGPFVSTPLRKSRPFRPYGNRHVNMSASLFQPLSGNHGRSDPSPLAPTGVWWACFNPSQEITAVPTVWSRLCGLLVTSFNPSQEITAVPTRKRRRPVRRHRVSTPLRKSRPFRQETRFISDEGGFGFNPSQEITAVPTSVLLLC